MVEEVIVAVVDEELAGGRIDVLGAGHRDGTAYVVQPVVGFVLDRLAGGLLAQALVETAALDHEAGNDAVEHGAVVETALHVAEEVLHADGCFFRLQLEFDFTHAGVQQYARVFRSQQITGEQQ